MGGVEWDTVPLHESKSSKALGSAQRPIFNLLGVVFDNQTRLYDGHALR
jgi:hypothetical protein